MGNVLPANLERKLPFFHGFGQRRVTIRLLLSRKSSPLSLILILILTHALIHLLYAANACWHWLSWVFNWRNRATLERRWWEVSLPADQWNRSQHWRWEQDNLRWAAADPWRPRRLPEAKRASYQPRAPLARQERIEPHAAARGRRAPQTAQPAAQFDLEDWKLGQLAQPDIPGPLQQSHWRDQQLAHD